MPDYWLLWLDRVELIGKIPPGSLRKDMRQADIVILRHAVAFVACNRAKLREQGIGKMLRHDRDSVVYMTKAFRARLMLHHHNRNRTLRAYRIAVRAWVWARAELRQKVWA